MNYLGIRMKSSDDIELEWPPTYTVKKHARARHVKLKTSIEHGLELIVPRRFNPKYIPEILEENKAWIEKHLRKIQEQSKNTDTTLPIEILFSGINQTWRIEHIPGNKKLKIIPRPHQELALWGNLDDKKACKMALIAWMKNHARVHLVAQLNMISEQIKLPFKNAVIRDQSSRWGSCSAEKTINLSYKLLFLPPELMRHILIHELCHTIHLDHSDKFWRLVASFDPNWQVYKKMLRDGGKYIPGWIK